MRLSEIYASYQGEGPNTGAPTVFVRFAGCNLRCPGWPCDTQHAIDPAIFMKQSEVIRPDELADRIVNKFPHVRNICLTGGEPFLQSSAQMTMLVSNLKDVKYNVEVFTNGQLSWPAACVDMIDNFIFDWKLPGSGENVVDDKADIERRNFETLGRYDAVKFTIKTIQDYEMAKHRYNVFLRHRNRTDAPVVFCGIVWGGELTTEQLAQRMLNDKLPWHLNVQVHKFIWDPEKRGV